MKEQKKDKEQLVEKRFGLELALDESLDKYEGPEFDPPKLKEIEKKFSKRIVIHQ